MSTATPAGTDHDVLKRAAANAAAELVRDGMLVGLGTGSTAAFALEALARRHRQGLRFVGIPTSEQTGARATALGIPLTSFTPHRQIDLTIDGADEVERGTLNLIKGLGGALLHEKIVASNSRRLAIIIVDEAKLVDRLGRRVTLCGLQCVGPQNLAPHPFSPFSLLARREGSAVKTRLPAATGSN